MKVEEGLSSEKGIRSVFDASLDFSKSRGQMLIIQGVRIGFHLAILVITISFQAFQPDFVNIDVLLPLYLLMAVSFTINALYLIFFERALRFWPATAFQFFFESIFITGLIHYTGVNQSIFLFLFLVNIILCGFVFLRRGAVILSLWTSVLFSGLMIFGPDLRGQALFFAVGINNLAFFAVAALSGFLSEQLNFMGKSLQAQGRDIRALRHLNSLIIDNIATGLMTLDEAGVVLQANRSALGIFDRSAKDVVHHDIESVLPGLVDRIRAFSLAQGANNSERFDFVYRDPNGDKLTLEMIVSALPADSEIGGYVITFQDLTRFRRLEYQMRQSEKMAAVGQLAAGIAHEIRNPLASISGSIQLLRSSFSVRQEDESRLMTIVLKEIDRLNNLITEFLDFVKPTPLKEDPIDINGLVKDILELLKLNQGLRADVVQVLNLNAQQEIAGDRDKLKQALLNIIINAYQAMGDVVEPQLNISSIDRGDLVILKIRDKGCGIDEVGLRKIFEPFHTTKPKGTGLGLAVVHKIVENHGARIFVESAKGVGTEFTLEFPKRSEAGVDKNALADSQLASENFSKAFRGQKRGNG